MSGAKERVLGRLGVIDGPPLDSIIDSTARFNIWSGPVRSAKTMHSLIRWLTYIKEQTDSMASSNRLGGDLLMMGKTRSALVRNVFIPLSRAVDGLFTWSDYRSEWQYADIRGFYLGAADSKAEGVLRGFTCAGAYCDEVSLWPQEVFNQLVLRMSVPGAKMFATTNPDGPYHWLKTDYIDSSNNNVRVFTWPLETNIYLDPDYIVDLKKTFTPGSLWYRRFILGSWVAAEGAVFDFWDVDEHVLDINNTPKIRYLNMAIDYGTSNPTAAGLFAVPDASTIRNLRVWLDDEWYYDGREAGKQLTDGETVDKIEAWVGNRRSLIRAVYVDPSAASFRAELSRRGWYVREAKNDVLEGIRLQANMLHDGSYKIASRCKQTIKDYGVYSWDRRAQARGEDAPLKGLNDGSHTQDMQRYFLFTEYENRTTGATFYRPGESRKWRKPGGRGF